MKYLWLILLAGLASCTTPAHVTPRADLTPVKVSNAATRQDIASTKRSIKDARQFNDKGSASLDEAIKNLEGLVSLTPPEHKALDYIREAKVDFGKAQQSAIEAWDYATKADQHAWEVEAKLPGLQKQIDDSKTNEENLAKQVAKFKPFYEFGHRFWGIGGIIQGFGILAGHLLILAAFIVLLLLIFWGLSLVFPILGPAFTAVSSLWRRK